MWIDISVYRDTSFAGDEDISLFLHGIRNANFIRNAPALVARGKIMDDDAGVLSRPAGLDHTAAGERGLIPHEAVVRIVPIAISAIEAVWQFQAAL